MIRLPVSIGEALDKLTILDIKCQEIHDESKRQYCKQEYDLLYEDLKSYVEENKFYYKLLRDVNKSIWIMQDDIRLHPDPQKCVDILDKNDMRFRIKDVINQAVKSYVREQKGYPTRRALFIGHMGLGDHIGLIGAVRYIALQYDETIVLCKSRNAGNVSSFFADNPTIKVWVTPHEGGYVPGKWPSSTSAGEAVDYNPEDWTKVYRSGFYTFPNHGYEDLPTVFYLDMGIDPQVRHTHFFLPTTPEANELYEKIRDQPYIFIQQVSSSHIMKIVTWDIDSILTIDPNLNIYPVGHKWHDIAQELVNRHFLSYKVILQHAKELHTIDSSFYCLACYIPLDAEVKKCYAREDGTLIPKYNFI